MCRSLRYIIETHHSSRPDYSEHCALDLLDIIVEAQKYVVGFVENGDIHGAHATGEFRGKLLDYRNQIRDCLRESVLVHNLVERGVLSKSLLIVALPPANINACSRPRRC